MEKDIGKFLRLPVKTMQNLEIPEGSYEKKRNQYYSTKILKTILEDVPSDAVKMLGVIDKDLCIPILTFVFGEAQLGGTAALVSLTRLRQEFYGLDGDPAVFYERIHKESLHELGHTYGLVHCSSVDCLMYLSNTVMDVDKKGRIFCRSCQEALISKKEYGRI